MREYKDKHNPNQGGIEASPDSGFESAGSPGQKETEPSAYASQQSDEGDYADAPMRAFMKARGLPSSGPVPDNISGSIQKEGDEPTKGEGS